MLNKNKVKNTSNSGKWYTCLVLLIITMIILVVVPFYILIWLISTNPAIPPNYSSEEVLSICEILHIDPDETFCSETSSQNMQTLEDTLNKVYPLSDTSYGDIVPFLSDWNPLGGSCNDTRMYDYCPMPDTCSSSQNSSETYACTFIIPITSHSYGEQLTIRISKSTGMIHRYEFYSNFE